MKSDDRRSSIFWLCFATFFFVGSLKLGVGRANAPGMGFISFGASLLLGALSIVLFLKTVLKNRGAEIASNLSPISWRRVLLILISLLLYAVFLPVAGYLVATFLFMAFLFWVVRRPKLHWVLTLSCVTTFVTYYVFVKWLNCQFPTGLFGF
jgi:putative tricarboxylic transport membrane protein